MLNLFDIQYIQVTAEYSNAVLLAILPHISDFAHRMELPTPVPITVQQVEAFGCDNHLGDTGGAVRLRSGYIFTFQHGYVNGFRTSNRYFDLQDPQQVPTYYGVLKMTADEAVELCRSTLRRLGYTPETLYADLLPKIKGPPQVGTNIVPRYHVDWVDPRDGTPSCQFEVNAQDKRIEDIFFLNRNLWRRPPTVDVRPQPRPGTKFKSAFQPVNLGYAKALLAALIPELSEYIRRLELPITIPIGTNQLASYVCRRYFGGIYADLILTNGYHFFYRDGMFQVFDAPDSFFNFPLPGVRVKDFVGTWRMSEEEAAALARATLRKLGFSEKALFAEGKPEVERPHNVANVPRLRLDWTKSQGSVQLSKTVMEIDAEHKLVKSILILNHEVSRPMPPLVVSSETAEEWQEGPP